MLDLARLHSQIPAMTTPRLEPSAWRRRDDCFTVAGFFVDPTRNVVAVQSREEALEPRIMDVLCFLAEHPGESLTRMQIIDAVWARSFGADESLTRAVSRLRKILGDAHKPAQFIETIP